MSRGNEMSLAMPANMADEAARIPMVDAREVFAADFAPTRNRLYTSVLESSAGQKAVALIAGGTLAASMGGDVFGGGTATAANETAAAGQTPGVTVEFHSGSASAKDVATKKVTFVMNNTVKGAKAEVKKSPNCSWTKKGEVWQNSYKGANGKLVWREETTPAKLCKTSKGLVKVDGGETGAACYNAAKKGEKAPGPKLIGEIKVIGNFNQNVHLKAVAKAAAAEKCGYANAYASVKQNLHMSVKDYVKTKGSAQLSIAGKLYDKAEAKANASVTCVDVTTSTPANTVTTPGTTTTETTTTTTPTTPENHILSVDLTRPEHVLVGGIVQICAIETDSKNDVNGRAFSSTGEINKISNTYPGNDPNEYCADFKGGTVQGEATVTYTATDPHGKATDSETFPIEASKGQF